MVGGGKWIFQFKYAKKGTLDLSKYQSVLQSIRQDFEPQFAQMNIMEGEANWTTPTIDANQSPSYAHNIFAQFSYKCTRTHMDKGPGHGTWKLLWNPKLNQFKNKLHARCAPQLFKELSNQIQEKLKSEFPHHFSFIWQNGISGYESLHQQQQNFVQAMAAIISLMNIGTDSDDGDEDEEDEYPIVQDFDLESDRCPHYYPWGYCPTECYLALIDDDYF